MNRQATWIWVLVAAVSSDCGRAAVVVSQPYPGVTRIVRTESVPRPENMNIVEIDLSDPAIHFKLSPANPPSPNTFNNETRVQTTLAYLNQEGAQLAVNVHFFDFPANSNGGTNLTGIAASMGNVYSSFEANPVLSYAIVPNSPALNIDAGNHAAIVQRGATDTSLASGTPFNTLSGSAQIITDGVKTLPDVPTKPNTNPPLHWYTDQIAARTAIGLSQDGRTLFLFTVDAAGSSQGMSVDEMADFLRTQYGVYNALNLDGGGSTTLAMADPVTRIGSVINVVSGGARAVGSSLAIFAVVLADLNEDGNVDAADFALFIACKAGADVFYDPGALPLGCTLTPDGNGKITADFDKDGDVDQSDFGVFQRSYP